MSSLFVAGTYAVTTIKSVPFTITKSGTYILTANLTLSGTGQTAIAVNASNVVIDLSGLTLSTSDTTNSNIGIIDSTNSSNVTIQNGSIYSFNPCIHLFGSEETVQNIRLESVGNGILAYGASTLIQNCFIVGNGTAEGIGLGTSGSLDVVVKNNLIVSENVGVESHGNNSFIYNWVGSCNVGFNLGSTDKYQGNLTTLCTTTFTGGIAVGDENN